MTDRDDAIASMRAIVEDEDSDEPPSIIICQGPPSCMLQGEEAERAQYAGCVWCERHMLLPSGAWHVEKPGKA